MCITATPRTGKERVRKEGKEEGAREGKGGEREGQVYWTRGKGDKEEKEGFTPTEVGWFVRFNEGVSYARVAEADMFMACASSHLSAPQLFFFFF